jgi:hypothetical protein
MTDTPLTPELYDDLLERYVKATAEAETWRDKSAQFHREGVRLKAILSDLRAWLGSTWPYVTESRGDMLAWLDQREAKHD